MPENKKNAFPVQPDDPPDLKAGGDGAMRAPTPSHSPLAAAYEVCSCDQCRKGRWNQPASKAPSIFRCNQCQARVEVGGVDARELRGAVFTCQEHL